MRTCVVAVALCWAAACAGEPENELASVDDVVGVVAPAAAPSIKTVFLIVMENKNWWQVKSSWSAPYINNVLLPQASYTDNYNNPSGLHPSEGNYIWLEAGSNLGVSNDNPPAQNHLST